MRPTATGATVLVLLALQSAAAEPCHTDVDYEPAPNAVALVVTTAYSGADADHMRSLMDDEHGNSDGQATRAEATRFEAAWARDAAQSVGACVTSSPVLADGASPATLERWQVEVDLGPPAGQGDVHVTNRLAFGFVETDHRNHEIWPGRLGGLVPFLACAGEDIEEWDWGDHPCGQRPGDASRTPGVLLVRAPDGFQIRPSSIEPTQIRESANATGIRITSAADHALLQETPLRLALVPASEMDRTTVAVIGAAIALSSAAVLWNWRRITAWLVASFQFTRLTRNKVAAHPVRARVLDVLHQDGPTGVRDLQARMGTARGTLTYHLDVLQRAKLVEHKKDGGRLVAALVGDPRRGRPQISDVQATILDKIAAHPGVTATHLHLMMGMPRRTLGHHLDRLEDSGLIERRKEGRRRRVYPKPPHADRAAPPQQPI